MLDFSFFFFFAGLLCKQRFSGEKARKSSPLFRNDGYRFVVVVVVVVVVVAVLLLLF